MEKRSYLSYSSPGFIIGISLLVVSFINLATIYTNWSIGPAHFYFLGATIILFLSVVLGIVFMYWNARWEKSFIQKHLADSSAKDIKEV